MSRVEFGAPPPVGLVLSIGGQRYELQRIDPHTRLDGTKMELAVWSSPCRQCGAEFEVRCKPLGLPEVRNCELHRKGRAQ